MYSKSKLKELIKEEKASAKEYAKHGLKSLAKDELKHAFFLSQRLRK